MSLPSVSPGYEYDQSGVTMAEVPALSPLSALPPKSAQHPLTALVAVSTAVAPPKVDSSKMTRHPSSMTVPAGLP